MKPDRIIRLLVYLKELDELEAQLNIIKITEALI